MPTPPICLACAKSFGNVVALQSHCYAKGHPCFVCKPCDRAFVSFGALEQHLNSPRHNDDHASSAYIDGRDESDDEVSDDEASGEEASEEEASDEEASDEEASDEEASDDEDSEEEASEDASDDEASDDEDTSCASCNREFRDMDALNQHLMFSAQHNWCFTCSRDFGTETALAQHQASIVHDNRDFKCPFCMAWFKSPSGIAHHVESGCHKFTRHHVTAAVQAMDIIPNISIKRITGPPSLPTLSRLIATEASFNGRAYTCYLCRKSCKTLSSLNVHLNSAAHDDDEFRCPKCKREFTVISGFVQHLESQCCGLAGTTQIEGFFNDLSDQFSRLLKP